MKRNLFFIALVVLFCALSSVPLWSQTVTAQVGGTVTDAGKPLPNVQVTLTNRDTNRVFKLKTDKNGKFSGVGVPYGDYDVEIISASGEKLYKQRNSVAPGQTSTDVTLNIDISETKSSGTQSQSGQTGAGASGQPGQAAGQQPKYTKEQVEQIKAQNAKAENFNVLIKQVNDAMQSKNWQDAISPLQQLILADPGNWQYYSGLGDAQSNLEQYDQAVETYQKGIQAAQSNTTVDPKNASTDPAKKKAGIGHMLTSEGNDYLKMHKNKEAVDAYTQAASLDPNPGVA